MAARRSAAGCALAAVALVLAGCSGSSSPQHSSSSAQSNSSASSGPSSQTSPTATSSSGPDPAQIGQVIFSSDDLTAACSPGGPGGSGSSSDSDSDSDTGSGSGPDVSGRVVDLLPGGVEVATCTATSDGSDTVTVVAIDMVQKSVLWSRPISRSDPDTGGVDDYVLTGGAGHVFLLDVTTVPASGLNAAYYTRTVTAIDVRSGATSWQKPLEPDDRTTDSSDGTVTEVPGPGAGQTEALVNVDDFSAFDATAGTPLWRVPRLDRAGCGRPTFVAYNLALCEGSDAGDDLLYAFDIAAGKIAWTDRLNGRTSVVGSFDRAMFVDGAYWFFADTGYDAFDVRSGKHTVHGVYPTSWTHVLSTPAYTVANVGGTLRGFKTGAWGTPLWSLSASEDAQPRLLTDDCVLVDAPAGTQLLSMSDGSTLSYAGPDDPEQSDLTDGLVLDDTGDVIEFAPPTR